MTEISMASGKLNVGGVFNQAFSTLKAKPLFFVFTGLMFGIAHLALSRSGINGPDPSAISPGLVLVGVLLLVVLGAISQTLAARATEGPLGTNASLDFAPAVQAALPRLPNVILTTLALLFLVLLGFVALILPGIVILLMLCVALPAFIPEDLSPIAALKRSRELTRGNRWRLLGLVLLNGLILIGVGVVVSLPLGLASTLPGPAGGVFSIISSAVEGFVGVFIAVLYTHAFLDLRRLHEASAPAPLI
ncbi:glycerophosphoryl diester phosphodiesterase membrane domain-containing protein [Phenylobacterium sp.]|uniref:glycerophosphoryl diester phosphodiesterase membrane domain-containing protein n=2 Tax=Phenylobacterium sp. TaxID=1871053 RepID=UPI0025DF1B56|nr:glycerophosphoryl diester phosphodiesterase membrane domain-containing protein [Phenylobacterium sp.]MCA3720881.1 glycerophosphoryl diester phosphodiesterase membrane domain-containing protein [Phenylobacterium sp.]